MQKAVVTYQGSVEGLQEELYFKHLQNLINNSDEFSKRVSFKFKNVNGGFASNVVHKAKIYSSTDNLKVAVFDHDFKDDEFIKAIHDCKKYNIFPAYSIISFNLFLILHKQDYNRITTPDDNYLKDLRRIYKIDSKMHIKSEEGCLKIIKQITLEDVKIAIKRAKKLNDSSMRFKKEIIKDVYEQPFLNINKFVEQVFLEIR